MDDMQSIHRLKKGDISGLEILIARYQIKAVRAAFLITHDDAMAEDVVQDTFLRVSQRIRSFDETRSFEPYLLRSVVHAALDSIKKSSRQVALTEKTDPVLHLPDNTQLEGRGLQVTVGSAVIAGVWGIRLYRRT